MQTESGPKLFAAVLGLSCFTMALVAGAIAGNPGYVTLARAIPCMMLGYLIGWALGAVAFVAVREHVERYRMSLPIESTTQDVDATRTAEHAPSEDDASSNVPFAEVVPDG
jgi:hypothetical protein